MLLLLVIVAQRIFAEPTNTASVASPPAHSVEPTLVSDRDTPTASVSADRVTRTLIAVSNAGDADRPPCTPMKSKFFAQFGVPDADCQITPERDGNGVPRLMFRSKGNPLVALDIIGASQLRHLLVQAGNINEAYEIDRHIAAARLLALRAVRARSSCSLSRA